VADAPGTGLRRALLALAAAGVVFDFVACEALTNVAKYANAKEATVRVWRDGDVARIEIADDGIGGADDTAGSGLRGLADRVEALDGRLRVESPKGAGTVVTAELPCEP
jgi:signal transduction histidine kinase